MIIPTASPPASPPACRAASSGFCVYQPSRSAQRRDDLIKASFGQSVQKGPRPTLLEASAFNDSQCAAGREGAIIGSSRRRSELKVQIKETRANASYVLVPPDVSEGQPAMLEDTATAFNKCLPGTRVE